MDINAFLNISSEVRNTSQRLLVSKSQVFLVAFDHATSIFKRLSYGIMVLKVNNLSLPLMYTPTGPVLSTEDKYLAPIAWVINSALGGDISHFADSLAGGDDVFVETHFAVRPASDEVEPKDWERWRGIESLRIWKRKTALVRSMGVYHAAILLQRVYKLYEMHTTSMVSCGT